MSVLIMVGGLGYTNSLRGHKDGSKNFKNSYNQHIYIQPNRDLVIVKLSGNYHFKTNKDLEKSQHIDFFKSIVEQFPKNIIANKTVE